MTNDFLQEENFVSLENNLTVQDSLLLNEAVYSLKTSDFEYEFKKVEACIKKANNIFIVSHVKPDDDSFGSTRALELAIKNKYPKKIVIVLNDNSKGNYYLEKNDLLIFTDIGSWYRANMPENLKNIFVENYKTVNICRFDHHRNEEISDVTVDIEDLNAGSSCSLITLFLQSENYVIDKNIANLLFKGIISDTGRLQYSLSKTTLLAISILSESGVDYEKVYSKMYLQSPRAMKAKKYILGNYLTTKSGVAYIYLNDKIALENGFDRGEAAAMVHELGNISGCLIWMSCNDVGREIRCRIRSRYVSIDKVANKWGGGGHPQAVGVIVKSKKELSKLLDDLDEVIKEAKMKNPLLEAGSLEEEFLLEDENTEAQEENAEPQPTPIELASMINQDYINQMKALNKMYTKNINDALAQAHQESQVKDEQYSEIIKQYEDQMAQMQASFEQQFNDNCAKYEEMIANLNNQNAELANSANTTIQQYENQIAQMQSAIEDTQKQAEDQMAQIQSAAESQIKELSDTAQELDNQNQELSSQVDQLQQDHLVLLYPHLQPEENEEPFVQKYRKYVETHVANVKQSFDWISSNCPEVFADCDMEYLSREIDEHDLSKYSEEEFYPYARYFYLDKNNPVYKKEFDKAWNHHQKANKHHWEYWLLRDDEKVIPLDMPAEEIAHEICDWMSFGFKNGNLLDIGSYYQMNKGRMLMSPKTRKSLEERLQILVHKIHELEGANTSEDGENIQESINKESDLNLLLDLYEDEILNESTESKKAKEDKKKFKLFLYCIKFLTEESLAEILKASKHPVPSGKKQKLKEVRKLLSNMSDKKKEKIVNSEIMNTMYETVRKKLKKSVGVSAASGGTVSGVTLGTEAGIIGGLLAKEGAEVLAGAILLIPGAIVGLGVLALSLLGAGAGVAISVEQAKKKISIESSDKIKSIILDDIKEVE